MDNSARRTFLRITIIVAALLITAAVLIWVAIKAFQPLPGRDLTLAAGPPGSAYAQYAERYREVMAREGVRLHLVPTYGAVENLARLQDARGGVMAGFVQSGTTTEQASPALVSLGTVFYEPMWMFCRCSSLPELFSGPRKPRVSTGADGSATRPLALKILALNGLEASQLELSAEVPEEAARRLAAGEIDAAMMLSAWDAPVVQKLLVAPGITLLSWRRADAYVARDPKMSKLVLPEGVVDLAANRPPADVLLIASKASLVVRRNLHPALQYLLLRAAMEVHAPPAIFQRAGEFPAPEVIDLPLSEDAARIYKAGPSILQRTLPFWLAELVQRLLIIVLPLAGILYPLWSVLLKTYRWQAQTRVTRLYAELRLIERGSRTEPDAAARAQLLDRLQALERRALELRVPRAFSETLFNLRSHIRNLRVRLESSTA
ncbi:MAG: C4-dicarboxylate ABC transporter substrate-binding protein [Proteobacteria bacterium]|nr:C4-dicarboxylate ABC transporter substrate-binding protein [Pseudomonadota bacterium]